MRWIIDSEGDIGLSFWGIITFIKYKDSTIIYWFKRFRTAPRYTHIAISSFGSMTEK